MKKIFTVLAAIISLHAAKAQSINFEDLTLPANSAWKGQASTPGVTGFQSGTGYFVNSWDTAFGGFWSGFGYSNKKDSTSLNYATNELASIAASGNNNSDKYAVAYLSNDPAINIIRLPKEYLMGWAYLTNTTIAYRSMQNGDGIAKKFGGATGNDPDFFKVQFTGWYNGVAKNDTVDFYLADFRDTNNVNDYIVKDWTICNLSVLGKCDSLTYMISSSDTGTFGMNTPAYFCIDDINLIFTGTNDLSENQFLSAYPNPFNNNLTISNTTNEIVKAELLSMNGTIVSTNKVKSNERKSINTSALANGIYFIRITQGDQVYFQKMTK
jgi:hypothetical protein